MKKNSSSNPSIRRPSSRCLSGLPQHPKENKEKEKSGVHGPFPPPVGPARYDDYVTDCVAHAVASTFITLNAGLLSGEWLAPTASAELDAIYAAVLSGYTYDGLVFEDVMCWNQRELFVGIVEIEDDTICGVEVPGGKGFGFEAMNLPCHKVKVLAAAPACAEHPILEAPVKRLEISRRKFSLPKPKGSTIVNYVRGPYAAVIAYEPGSRVIARMRLWPVWYSAESGRMSFVRSNLERAAAGAFAEAGAVSFTLMSNKQMGYLQAGLGHRWSGDLTSYGFQPDCLPMPRINYRPAVVEMFGVRSLKRYDESKSRKKDAGLMNPDIRFVSIEGRLTPEDVIRWVKALMADPANGIWRQPAATNAAA